jgi:hypothetical protein
MTVGVNELRKEYEESNEWEANPIKRAVQTCLSGPLNNDNYRSKNPQQVGDALEAEFRARGLYSEARNLPVLGRLLRKVRKCRTTAEAIMAVGEYLLS